MDIFIKSVAGVLIALIMYLILAKQGKDISVLLTVAVCCMLAVAAIQYMEPVISFVNRLQQLSSMEPAMLQIILRAVGIGLLGEITALICADAGNAALGKSLQMLACGTVLWLSIPLFAELIDLIEEILLVT